MIKYSLRCDSNHQFEGWFRNSDDCEAQTASGQLECPICGSTAISKSLMAPRVTGTRSQNRRPVPQQPVSEQAEAPVVPAPQPAAPPPALKEGDPGHEKIKDMLRAYRQHVVDNSDYVGDKFAEEARKMHFNETETRGIYGEASVEDVKSLSEDGIDCLPLPVLPEDQN